MIELFTIRVQKCVNLDLKTWKFNMNRADRYWVDYKNLHNVFKEKFRNEFDNLNLDDEFIDLNDKHQAIIVFIEAKINSGEQEESWENVSFELNNTMQQLNANLRFMRKEPNEIQLPRIQFPKFDGSNGQNLGICPSE